MAPGGNAMKLESAAFAHNGDIPLRFTCDGQDIIVPLKWTEVPAGTKSFALIVDDPDVPDPAAPRRIWVHWVLYNLPASVTALPEKLESLPAGTLEGLNDWKQTGYRGPCPPIGKHRYFHRVYALDTVLPDLGKPDKAKLEAAMQGHILGQAELIGRYQRPGH
jgi:hypothetical protein